MDQLLTEELKIDARLSLMHVDTPICRNYMSQVERRWVRIICCAVGIADVVDGFMWQTDKKFEQ